MPILEIPGVGEAEVGDEFMSLSPADQERTIDEIAEQIVGPERFQQMFPGDQATPAAQPQQAPGGVADRQPGFGLEAQAAAPPAGTTTAAPTILTGPPSVTTADINQTAQDLTPPPQFGAPVPEKTLNDLLVENVTFGLGSDVAAGGRAIGDIAARVASGEFSIGDLVDGIASFPASLVGEDTTALGRAFQRRKAEEKAAFDKVRQEEGNLATAAEFGGAVLGAPVTGVGKGVKLATRFLPKVRQAAKEGAALGGVAGLGFSEGETVQERAAGGGTGALIGGVSGPLLTGAGTAAKAAFDRVIAPLGQSVFRRLNDTPFRAAVRNIAQKLGDEGITPERAVARVMRTVQQRSGLRLGDQGRQLQELLDTVGNVPGGTARTTVDRALDTRRLGRAERVQNELDVALGDSQAFAGTVNDLVRNRSELADVLYGLANRIQVPFTRTLERIMQRPSVRGALRDAVRKGEEEDVAGGLLGRFIQVGDDGSVTVTRVPDMAAWDRVKRALSERERVLLRAGRADDARLVGNTRRDLTGELDRHNPTYGLARQIFEGESELLDAARLGAEVVFSRGAARRQFNVAPGTGRPAEPGARGFNLEDALDAVQNMTRGEREFARLGAARALRAEIETIASQADLGASTRFVKQVFGTPASRRVLRELVGSDRAFRRFQRAMENEARGIRTEALRGGSRTQPRQQNAAELAGQGVEALGQAARGNIPALLQSTLRRLSGESVDPRVAAEIAEILTTRNRGLLDRFLAEARGQASRRSRAGGQVPGAVAAPAAAVRGGGQISAADVAANELLPELLGNSLSGSQNALLDDERTSRRRNALARP